MLPVDVLHVCWLIFRVGAGTGAGSEIVAVRMMVHPLASVTVTVYVPAGRPEAVTLVAPELQR